MIILKDSNTILYLSKVQYQKVLWQTAKSPVSISTWLRRIWKYTKEPKVQGLNGKIDDVCFGLKHILDVNASRREQHSSFNSVAV